MSEGQGQAATADGGGQGQPAGQGEATKFYEGFADEAVKTSKSIAKFKSAEDLAKSYLHLESRMGKSIALPGEDAGDDDWAQVFEKLGRPKAAEAYDLPMPEKVPDGLDLDPEMEGDFRLTAHKLGLTQKQAAGLHAWYTQHAMAAFENAPKAMTQGQAVAALKKEWGEQYEANRKVVNAAFDKYFDDAAVERFKAAGLLYDPAISKMMLAVGQKTNILEQTAEPKGSGAGGGARSSSTGGGFVYPNTPGMDK